MLSSSIAVSKQAVGDFKQVVFPLSTHTAPLRCSTSSDDSQPTTWACLPFAAPSPLAWIPHLPVALPSRIGVMRRQMQRLWPLLLLGVLISLLTLVAHGASPHPTNVPTLAATSAGVSAGASAAAATADVDPDFAAMALSPEEEDEIINRPAKMEWDTSRDTPPAAKQPPPPPPPPPPAVDELPAQVQLTLSGKTTVGDLCKQLPIGAKAPPPVGLSLAHLSRLLRAIFVDSALLLDGSPEDQQQTPTDEDDDRRFLRVIMGASDRELLRRAFHATKGDLREEDLPEIMDASMAILRTLALDPDAAARLAAYEETHPADMLPLDAPVKPSPIWRWTSHTLAFLHLHPGIPEEYDAFWAVLVGLAVALAAGGVGFACGARSNQRSLVGMVDASVRGDDTRSGGDSRRSRTPRHVFWANFGWVLFWLFLGAVLLFVFGYIHLFLELQTENRALASVAKAKAPPRECRMTHEQLRESEAFASRLLDVLQTFSPFTPRLQATKDADACVKYWQEYHRSTTPNPAYVLTQFVSRALLGPMTMAMEALGEGSYKFLGHHSLASQMLLMTFALLLIIGLAWTGGLGALACCCCGCSGRSNRNSGDSGRSRRYRPASAELREERRYYLEDASDSEEAEEAYERERRRQRNHHASRKLARLEDEETTTSKRHQRKDAAAAAAPRLRAASSESERDSSGRRRRRDEDDDDAGRDRTRGGGGARTSSSSARRDPSAERDTSRRRTRSRSASPRQASGPAGGGGASNRQTPAKQKGSSAPSAAASPTKNASATSSKAKATPAAKQATPSPSREAATRTPDREETTESAAAAATPAEPPDEDDSKTDA